MAILRSTTPLPYDAQKSARTAIIQTVIGEMIKDSNQKTYRVDVQNFRIETDDTGFETPTPIDSKQPYFLTYEEVDAARMSYKQGAQLTSEEEDELTEQVALKIQQQHPPFFSTAEDWVIVKQDKPTE
ncbi:hypothetical protein K5I29_04295 [Flavobacterium agricola]|uniref:Uncharacterized protein n=1 Tax=Flavobacterium agricola TaxID=2870839 RepID=A0ABY6M2T0_9FLAO|nr:hypothetical protein [Flavobacterium agricola]UYW02127.1 hypothetical protein K5I29_04295 [Flavobacterium agricola]